MYESMFGFSQRPFPATPDVQFYFPSSNAEQVRQTIHRIIQRAEGPALVLGGVGLGKSLIANIVARSLQQQFDVVMLSAAQLCSRRALLQSILCGLGMPYRELAEGELRLSLIDRLQPGAGRAPSGMVLLVDEANTLPIKLLEEIRMISNVVRDGQPRARVVLFGNMKLEHSFASPKLESFNQRIAARCYLSSLKQEETAQYIRHQLRMVGGRPETIATSEALVAVHRATEGIPRLINQLMDHAMMLAVASGQRPISASLIEEAWADLQQLPAPWSEASSAVAGHNSAASGSSIEFGALSDDLSDDLHNEDTDELGSSMESTAAVVSNSSNNSAIDFEEFLQINNNLFNNDLFLGEAASEESLHSAISSMEEEFRSFQFSPTLIDLDSEEFMQPVNYSPAVASAAPNSVGATGASRARDPFGSDFIEEEVIRFSRESDSRQAPRSSSSPNSNNSPSSIPAIDIPIFHHETIAPQAPSGVSAAVDFSEFWVANTPGSILDHAWQADTLGTPANGTPANGTPTSIENVVTSEIAGDEDELHQVSADVRDLIHNLNFSAVINGDSATPIPNDNGKPFLFGKPENEQRWVSEIRPSNDLPAIVPLTLASRRRPDSSFSDDRDILVIEEDIASHLSPSSRPPMRSVTSSYAQLFSRLRG